MHEGLGYRLYAVELIGREIRSLMLKHDAPILDDNKCTKTGLFQQLRQAGQSGEGGVLFEH